MVYSGYGRRVATVHGPDEALRPRVLLLWPEDPLLRIVPSVSLSGHELHSTLATRPLSWFARHVRSDIRLSVIHAIAMTSSVRAQGADGRSSSRCDWLMSVRYAATPSQQPSRQLSSVVLRCVTCGARYEKRGRATSMPSLMHPLAWFSLSDVWPPPLMGSSAHSRSGGRGLAAGSHSGDGVLQEAETKSGGAP